MIRGRNDIDERGDVDPWISEVGCEIVVAFVGSRFGGHDCYSAALHSELDIGAVDIAGASAGAVQRTRPATAPCSWRSSGRRRCRSRRWGWRRRGRWRRQQSFGDTGCHDGEVGRLRLRNADQLFMMPKTVPNSPTNGPVEPIVARMPVPLVMRRLLAATSRSSRDPSDPASLICPSDEP